MTTMTVHETLVDEFKRLSRINQRRPNKLTIDVDAYKQIPEYFRKEINEGEGTRIEITDLPGVETFLMQSKIIGWMMQ